MNDATLSEIIRRATTAGFLRSNHTESRGLIEHLLANGFQYVGPGLEQEPPRQKPQAFTTEGQPIYSGLGGR